MTVFPQSDHEGVTRARQAFDSFEAGMNGGPVEIHPLIQSFMKELQEFERSGDATPLASLFSENAELVNLTRGHPSAQANEPSRSPREFWHRYRRAFDRIGSHFTHVAGSDRYAALEWVAQGALPNATPIEYTGVSILEWNGGLISRFRVYYDSAVFTPLATQVEPAPQASTDFENSPQISS